MKQGVLFAGTEGHAAWTCFYNLANFFVTSAIKESQSELRSEMLDSAWKIMEQHLMNRPCPELWVAVARLHIHQGNGSRGETGRAMNL